MHHLIEYIGATGVKTTNLAAIRSRLDNPTAGDVIDFSKVLGNYPFLKEQFGTVDRVGDGAYCGPDEVHICSHMGSIFLGWDSNKREPYVSISGGPFTTVKKSRLVPAYRFRNQTMWNWGDNLPGADQGVYYTIARPVFILMPAAE